MHETHVFLMEFACGFPRLKHACNAAMPVAYTIRTQVNQIHANYNNLRVKFYMPIFLICVYFLVYFCVYIFTRVFHACFSRGICMQYGGFPCMKHTCNAAMPVACTVYSVFATQ